MILIDPDKEILLTKKIVIIVLPVFWVLKRTASLRRFF